MNTIFEELEKEYNSVTPEMVEAEYALLVSYCDTLHNPTRALAWFNNQIQSNDTYNATRHADKGSQYALWAKYTTIKAMRSDSYGLRD